MAGPPHLLLAAAAWWAVVTPAGAEVLQIGDDGAVVRQDGPALYLSPDGRPAPIGAVARPATAPRTAPEPMIAIVPAVDLVA